MNQYKSVAIGNRGIDIPLIQGGMGIGVSRSNLAGSVASQGGMGVISTAQIGYDEPGFMKDPEPTNLLALPKHIKIAKEISGGRGMVAVNIMHVTQLYGDYVRAVCESGVDAIITGAGLPTDLPEYTKGFDTAIAPIASSAKSANVILKYWDKKYGRTADFLVIEGPMAGGHLGFSPEQLEDISSLDYDSEVKSILAVVKTYEEKYGVHIPVFFAGGVATREDVSHAISLGVDGVQVASRFVATEECDAHESYKQAYIDARPEDIVIIQSPVGLPGRAIRNKFITDMEEGNKHIRFCYNCLRACNPKTAKYCISQALINAVVGNLDEGLIFSGYKSPDIDRITTVSEVIKELITKEE